MNEISPYYQINLINNIEKTLWETFEKSKYKRVETYMNKWRECVGYEQNGYGQWEDFDFDISKNEDGNIDLFKTLSDINGEKLLKIAIDLGIETPDYIPMIPMFRNELKTDYKNASTSFEKAFRAIESDPAEAVGYANSVLESILKEILKDERFSDVEAKNLTSKQLVRNILKKFELNPDSPEMPSEMRAIGTSLTSIAKSIEDLRSDKTLLHGQDSEKYLIDQPLYAYFVINSCATVGLFLINFYQTKFPKIY